MSLFRKMAGQSTAADAGLQRRCTELRAEKAALSLALRRKSEELAVLRNTLAAAPRWADDALLLVQRLHNAFEAGPVDGIITLRDNGYFADHAKEILRAAGQPLSGP